VDRRRRFHERHRDRFAGTFVAPSSGDRFHFSEEDDSMPARRAEVISTAKLSKSIDRAVALAMRRHAIRFEKPNLSIKWEIIGRIIRELEDMNGAFAAAKEITKNVEIAGIKATPACCGVDGGILIGFVERAGIPRDIGR
jgi:hypothetical protein